jgi:hypothetical protein
MVMVEDKHIMNHKIVSFSEEHITNLTEIKIYERSKILIAESGRSW